MIRKTACLAVATFALLATAFADGPPDNQATNVRRVPAVGIEVPAIDQGELEKGLKTLADSIAKLSEQAKTNAKTRDLLPDVQIYWKAVHDALTHREFFVVREIAKARGLLKEGQARADALLAGNAPWTTQTGPVVRGYLSKIDGSVQPYGLVIPANYTDKTAGKYRLDLWFHGRGEVLSEVNFIDERRLSPGQFTPTDTIVLHPYGRYCNANKFAGEVDTFEALESAAKHYRIDDDRISSRGFSMGGAAAWQFAVHFPDMFFAANPGAGFAETPRFLDVFQKEKLEPTWYEKKLWNMYDCDKVAANLRQVPTVAYSGENDSQKQAADVMAEALAKEGITLTHIIGPKTKHAYHPESKKEVERRMAELARVGRTRTPKDIHFVTYTLKYNKSHWITIDGMAEHWSEARIDASLIETSAIAAGAEPVGRPAPQLHINTRNVTAFTIDFAPGTTNFHPVQDGMFAIEIDNDLQPGRPTSDGSLRIHFMKTKEGWKTVPNAPTGPVKRHDLQGPIDDAFMDSFIIVRPTGTASSGKFAAWCKAEMDRSIEHWRRQFRGDARVKNDVEITDAEIASSNLILWGDPSSNAVLKKIQDKLPVGWKDGKVGVDGQMFPADDHAVVAIYPNPLNSNRYVVLNSGFTFRDYDYLNNARQVPKLPDWAVVDLNTPPNSRYPGKIVAADFFGESWQVRSKNVAK